MKESMGDFLLRRLQEVGIQHIFGVPGDYNLELMQQAASSSCVRIEPIIGWARVRQCGDPEV